MSYLPPPAASLEYDEEGLDETAQQTAERLKKYEAIDTSNMNENPYRYQTGEISFIFC